MTAPSPVRAHNLLCLLGYRGKGYDDRFVAGMTALQRTLRADPASLVEIRAAPDLLCAACPNLEASGCALGGREHEAHMRAQDLDVASRLGLEPGAVVSWKEVLARVAAHVRGADLPAICTTCPWLPLGWCAEGIERVRRDPDRPGLAEL